MSSMEVDLALNSRRFQAGVQDAERELENLSDVFEDLVDASTDLERAATDAMDGAADAAKDAEDAYGDLARKGKDAFDDTGDAAKDADREVKDLADRAEDLADEFREAGRKVKDLGDDADSAADKARRGFNRAEGAVDEFKDEARQTARETAASFSSVEDAIDGVQELAANALGGFGPAGVVGGIAAAAGIGLAVSAFEAVNEANEVSKERAAEWGQAFIDAGDRVLSAAAKAQMGMDIVNDPARWQEAQDNAREWGVSTSVALAAMTGETWALEAANAALTEREREAAGAAAGLADGGEALADVLGGQTAQTRNGRQALDDLNREIEAGIGIADTYSTYLVEMARNTDGATSSVDEFGDTVYSLPDGTTVYVDAETGRATRDVDQIERRIYGIPDGQANVTVNTSSADGALIRWQRQRRTINVTANVIARNGMPLAV